MRETRPTRVRFRERAELLDFLLEVAAITSETLNLEQLLGNVATVVRQVIPHELFAILLYSERRKGLRIRYARGHRKEVVHNLIIPLGEGITGAAAASGQPVMVGDVYADQRYLNALDAVRSELAVPMVLHGKLVGVIDLQSTTPEAFTPQDQALLQLIASRVGAAIENARLYRRVERQNRTQRTLALLGQEFSSILQLDALLDRIAKSVKKLINYDAFMVLLLDEQQRMLRSRFSLRYDERSQAASMSLDRGITGAAASEGRTILVGDISTDPRYVESHVGIRSEIAVPLIVQDRVIGVMDLESERVNYFTEEHARTLSLIAPQIAISIENARLYEELAQRERAIQKDLEAAQQLQAIIMPSEAPAIAGLDVGVVLRPARLVSGDLYDFFEYDDDHAMLAFGDSSGKGAAAALYGALFSGLLRSLAPRRRSPALLLKSLNDTLMERQVPARYVTLLVMLWQAAQRQFIIANAGSTTPMVCRGGEILHPRASGVPIGLLEHVDYEETVFDAEPGDLLILFSDGISDQVNEAGEEYGKRRFQAVLKDVCDLTAQQIANRVLEDCREFRGSVPVHDDQTLVVLRVA
ncbi:MAG: GAF domain-containing protein [Bryobacteraceae bacterium]|nr:GAF domain-containing protein [Bryobacteraceae bacterium]